MTDSGRPPVGLRYAPHFALMSFGYAVFAFAAVPSFIRASYDVGFAAVGLLMTVLLFAVAIIQIPTSQFVDKHATTTPLLGALVIQIVLVAVIDVVGSFLFLLILRGAIGLTGGVILTAGATHIARLYSGREATLQQGIYGGMLSLGGVLAFGLAPSVVRVTEGIGLHGIAMIPALPAVFFLWRYRGNQETLPVDREQPRIMKMSMIFDPFVLLVAFTNVAVLSTYHTISTFITAYFNEVGIDAPLNVLVLLLAAIGRMGGGISVNYWNIDDGLTITSTALVATVGLLGLTLFPPALRAVLPLIVMLAVTYPHGSIYNLAATVTANEGAALSIVVAISNLAALTWPTLTGIIRDTTGGYNGAFLLLAGLNFIAIGIGFQLSKISDSDPKDELLA